MIITPKVEQRRERCERTHTELPERRQCVRRDVRWVVSGLDAAEAKAQAEVRGATRGGKGIEGACGAPYDARYVVGGLGGRSRTLAPTAPNPEASENGTVARGWAGAPAHAGRRAQSCQPAWRPSYRARPAETTLGATKTRSRTTGTRPARSRWRFLRGAGAGGCGFPWRSEGLFYYVDK